MKYATCHGAQRAKERLNLSSSRADDLFERVLRYGKRYNSFQNAQQQKYLREKENDSRVFVYEDYCYIFDSNHDVCITTYELPKWFHRGTHYRGKERIRNIRKYNRLYPELSVAV